MVIVMSIYTDQNMISSRELLEKTGISRATLNNYIKLGLLPRPRVKPAGAESRGARRIGYFPRSVLSRIESVKQLKREGVPMEEIARKFESLTFDNRSGPEAAALTAAPAQDVPSPELGSAKNKEPGLSLTIEDIDSPAYLINQDFEIEWINREAEELIFNSSVSQIASQESRNVFKLFFGWEFHEHLENWQEVLAFHMRVVKTKMPRSRTHEMYEGISGREISLLERVYDEVIPLAEQSLITSHVTCVHRDGSSTYYQVSTVFFREGVFFVYVPEDKEDREIAEYLSCRRTVINELLKRRMPSLVNLCVLVADLQDSVKVSAELLPAEYFEMVNSLWQTMGAIFEKYNGLSGKHAGDGVLYYFVQRPRSDYIMDAIACALEVKERMKEFSNDWKVRKGWLNDLYLNIGLNEGQEFFGTIRSASNIEFTALGDTINYAGRLSDFARYGSIWTTKHLINKLDYQEQKTILFGVSRRDGDREVFIKDSFVRLADVLDLTEKKNVKFSDIAILPITEITGADRPADVRDI